MAQDYKNIAIIGAGASGCLCAYFLLQAGFEVTLFDKASPLRTLLPTGGGRCNLAHAEYDFKELAKNYPRGEKFLYSIFSKFSTADTIEVFEKMGIKTYIQANGRIFPESNSAKDVREKVLNNLKKVKFVKEEVVKITPIDGGFRVKTVARQNIDTSPQPSPQGEGAISYYFFTDVILAIGGHSGMNLIKDLRIKVVEQKPSLVGLNTKESFKNLSGTVIKNVSCKGFKGDILFTHFGISGPLVYTISSVKAFDKFPYKLSIDLAPELVDLQKDLNIYPHKEIKNILNKYLPQKIVSFILQNIISENTKAHQINGKTRDLILERIHYFEAEIIGTNKGEETVSAGGIDLNELNPKTMELKSFPNLYAIGEILNIDGLCGGYNLQNAWSTAYVCAKAINLLSFQLLRG